MKKQKYAIKYTLNETAVVIESLIQLRNVLIREHKDYDCVNELLLKVMRAPVKKN